MTKEFALDEVFAMHRASVDGEPAGVRAELTSANLESQGSPQREPAPGNIPLDKQLEANLAGADLACAAFARVDLTGAQLSGA
jgi:uncharacterized protein YjbI with pentapeptide repeats